MFANKEEPHPRPLSEWRGGGGEAVVGVGGGFFTPL